MGILAVDSMGRIYQTSGDREDQRGFGHYPECESQSDVTLGNAYLNAERERTNSVLARKRNQRLYDQAAEREAKLLAAQLKESKRQDSAKAEILRNPTAMNAVMKQGLSMGCSSEYSPPMNGNVFTANGQSGFRGMTRDQQVIHNAVLGMGSDTSHPADPTLVRQHQARAEADRRLRLGARPGARTNKTSL